MNMDILTLALCLMLAFTFLYPLLSLAKGANRKKLLPPGPVPLPIIGNIHKLGKQPHKSLANLAKIYGPIIYLKLGSVNTIVISSSDTAKEVLQKQDLAFSSRSIQDALRSCDHFQYSVVYLPVANRWRSLRKIMNSNIFSGNKLDANQHLRRRKVEELIGYCYKRSQSGEAVDIGQAAFTTSLNLLSNTVFTRDLADFNNKDSAKEFKDMVWNILFEAGKPNLVDFFPVLKKIDPQGIKRRLTIHLGDLLKIFGGLINERLELRRLGKHAGNTAGAIDELLNISIDNPNEIDINHMEHMCVDLFVAGTDTTSSTVEWAMAELLKSPEKMVKAKTELNQVIGRGKILEEADVSSLPYLRSIMKETLRLHPPVPFLIPRKVEKEVEVLGYTIPKNSQVLVNAWAMGRNPNVWDNPLSFHPERFLASDIDIRGQDFELIPFGAGRRICPGLPLAIRMVPLMLGSLLNLFDWTIDGGVAPKELDMEENFGLTLQRLHPLLAVPTPVVV